MYDYVDAAVSVLARMAAKRETGYKGSAWHNFDRHEIPRSRNFIQTDTTHAGHLAVHSRVVVSKEAHPRSNARQEIRESGGFAHELTTPMPFEPNASRCIVRQNDVYGSLARLVCQALHFIPREMSPSVGLKAVRSALVIRGAIAATDAAHPNRLRTIISKIDRLAVRQVGEVGKHVRTRLRIEPLEVLVITFDEHGTAWRRTLRAEPFGKVSGAFMPARGFVDSGRVGSDAEVAHVQHVVETDTERGLERENIVVQAIHRAVYVAGRADKHGIRLNKPLDSEVY